MQLNVQVYNAWKSKLHLHLSYYLDMKKNMFLFRIFQEL